MKPHLTNRECEILALLCEGHTAEQIGRLLYLEKHTVDWHIDHIYKKLDVHSNVQAYRRAMEWGFVEPPGRIDE